MQLSLKRAAAAIVCILCGITAWAYDFVSNGIYYDIISTTSKTVEVTYGTNAYSGSVTIPATVTYSGAKYSVTEIGSWAFSECTSLKSVSIPNSVTKIGGSAFSECAGLTSIAIPNSVTEIGSSAFEACTSLTSITIPANVVEIDYMAFSGCTGLTTLNYNAVDCSVGFSTFEDCDNLKTLNIGEGVVNIPDGVFKYLRNVTAVTIPNSVRSIGEYAFQHCEGLTEITIPNGVETIKTYAFSNCRSLETVNFNAENCTFMGTSVYGVFSYCDNLTTLNVGDAVTNIPDYAFGGCESLTTINMSNSLKTIGGNAFYDCAALLDVTIPSGVASIGDYAFKYCKGLRNVVIADGDEVLNMGMHVFQYASIDSLYWGRNLSYKADMDHGYSPFAKASGLRTVMIGEKVTSIPKMAFYQCSGLGSITIPEGLTEIGESAFSYCSGLKIVNFNAENCATIGSLSYPAFYSCYNLATINIGKTVTNIPDYAFMECSGLAEITIPASVTAIGSRAFDNCYKLKKFVIEDGDEVLTLVTKYLFGSCSLETLYLGRNLSYSTSEEDGFSPFSGMSSLTSLTIGERVTSLGEHLFRGCSMLPEITIPQGMREISAGAFHNCSGLKIVNFNAENCAVVESVYTSAFGGSGVKLVNIGDAVKRIPDKLFQNCSSLQEINFSNSVTEIGDYAFEYCPSLTSLVIPNSVKEIGDNAFSLCSGIVELDIPDSVEKIGAYAFENCSDLTEVTIPNGVKEMGEGAFYSCRSLTTLNFNAENCVAMGTEASPAFYNCVNMDTLYIGESVRNIPDYAFCSFMSFLDEITSLSIIPPTITNKAFDESIYASVPLYVPEGSKAMYVQAEGWENFVNIIDGLYSGAKEINADADFGIDVAGGRFAVSGVADDTVVNVYTLNGALLLTTTASQVSNTTLPAGIYLVQVDGAVKKVII